jgi:hypothetical protein
MKNSTTTTTPKSLMNLDSVHNFLGQWIDKMIVLNDMPFYFIDSDVENIYISTEDLLQAERIFGDANMTIRELQCVVTTYIFQDDVKITRKGGFHWNPANIKN